MVDNWCCVCRDILDTKQERLKLRDAGLMLASLFSYFTKKIVAIPFKCHLWVVARASKI